MDIYKAETRPMQFGFFHEGVEIVVRHGLDLQKSTQGANCP